MLKVYVCVCVSVEKEKGWVFLFFVSQIARQRREGCKRGVIKDSFLIFQFGQSKQGLHWCVLLQHTHTSVPLKLLAALLHDGTVLQ